jgi:hypothetical protein
MGGCGWGVGGAGCLTEGEVEKDERMEMGMYEGSTVNREGRDM